MPSSVNLTPLDLSHTEEGEWSSSIGSMFPSGTRHQWPRYRTLCVRRGGREGGEREGREGGREGRGKRERGEGRGRRKGREGREDGSVKKCDHRGINSWFSGYTPSLLCCEVQSRDTVRGLVFSF